MTKTTKNTYKKIYIYIYIYIIIKQQANSGNQAKAKKTKDKHIKSNQKIRKPKDTNKYKQM